MVECTLEANTYLTRSRTSLQASMYSILTVVNKRRSKEPSESTSKSSLRRQHWRCHLDSASWHSIRLLQITDPSHPPTFQAPASRQNLSKSKPLHSSHGLRSWLSERRTCSIDGVLYLQERCKKSWLALHSMAFVTAPKWTIHQQYAFTTPGIHETRASDHVSSQSFSLSQPL
jgi:hypothetical protein